MQLHQVFGTWKNDALDIHHLYALLAPWHGPMRCPEASISHDFARHLQVFKAVAVDGIGGRY